MSTKARYLVVQDEPAHSKEANEFLSRCDLGIIGAFVRKVAYANVTFENEESHANFPETYRKAVEAAGGMLVFIQEVEATAP